MLLHCPRTPPPAPETNEGHCCCWDWINISWCLFCHVSLSRSPAPRIAAGMGEQDDAALQGGGLSWASLPCPASPPTAPCEGRQGLAGTAERLGLLSLLLSECFSPVKSIWAVGAPLAMVCAAQVILPWQQDVTQCQPTGPMNGRGAAGCHCPLSAPAFQGRRLQNIYTS